MIQIYLDKMRFLSAWHPDANQSDNPNQTVVNYSSSLSGHHMGPLIVLCLLHVNNVHVGVCWRKSNTPYLPLYKSTFYSLKISPKNHPRLIRGKKLRNSKIKDQFFEKILTQK